MIKIINLDRLFDKYIEGYVLSNVGKIKPEEIEDKIPVLYEEFGNAPQKELDGETPNGYYKRFSPTELIAALKEHIDSGVEVSDFLVEAITAKPESAKVIKSALMEENGEQFTAYLMNMLADLKADVPVERYLEFALYDYPEEIGELATEALSAVADKAKDAVLKCFDEADENKKGRLSEILSCVKNKSDDVFDRLVLEFVKHKKEIPLYASYLAKYGDDRAIPFLKTAIEGKVNYMEFEELKFAIEVLGGEYEEKRDFTDDVIYKKIKGESRAAEKSDKSNK
ncbi:MAG: hypothetical protein IJU83_00965 [Clostridia bacterium]|nr:hypothetical protein [Clostridia bacterium]